ncbi:Outer membrane protein (porin) [Burkholderia sp. WP9]|uniref:porin n=1 Tax=Burkholderia sp. WP9 TaxID=1500263 RepID=UPI000899DA62|nr:porin [Burkholderia sp. WP9]SEF08220.1 Outer membrane protein (porin) [Burkholderia sp. WP9]
MKKHYFALSVLSALASVGQAQSNMTFYGILDEGVNYNSNAGGKRLYSLTSGGLQASRWGLRGAEDLGSGMKAVFVLENGFDVSTGKLGQGGLMFGRQAYVGVSGGVGTITLGRQYDSVVDYVGPLESGDQWASSMGAHPGDLDNLNNSYRTNNTIKYTSANLAGLTFGGTYSMGGVAGNFTSNQIWSLGAGYVNGPLVLGVGYLNARTPAANNGSMFGNNTSSSTASSVTTPVYSGFVSANTYQVVALGAAYTFGATTIGATYSNIRFMDLGAVASLNTKGYVGTATFNNAELNVKYQLTPTLLVGAAFDYTKGSDVSESNGATNPGAKYLQTALGVDYFLSKRTDMYVVGIYQSASGTGSSGKPAVAAINTQIASSSDRQTFLRIGMRHKF